MKENNVLSELVELEPVELELVESLEPVTTAGALLAAFSPKIAAKLANSKAFQAAKNFGGKIVNVVKKVFKKDDDVQWERDVLGTFIVCRWSEYFGQPKDFTQNGFVVQKIVYPMYDKHGIRKFKARKIAGNYVKETEQVVACYYEYVATFEPDLLSGFEAGMLAGKRPSYALYGLLGLDPADKNVAGKIPPIDKSKADAIFKQETKQGKTLQAGFAGNTLLLLVVVGLVFGLANAKLS
jgi:hypothetical protein